MLQTTPSSSGSGIPLLDLSPAGASAGGGASGDKFSQTLGNQMDRARESVGHDNRQGVENRTKKARDNETHETQGESKAAAVDKDESAEELAVQDKEAGENALEDGKDLPLLVATLAAPLEPEAVTGKEKLIKTPSAKESSGDGQSAKQQQAMILARLGEQQLAKDSVTQSVKSELNGATMDSEGPESDVNLSQLFSARLKEMKEAGPATLRGEGAQEGRFAFGKMIAASQASARAGIDLNSNVATIPAATNTPLQSQASTAAVNLESLTLQHPVSQKGWDQAMGSRVVWMARQNIPQVQLQLNPRELGPIEIKLSLSQDQATVNFSAHHPATREALEAAMPRLREMLGEQGFNLAHSDVSEHPLRQNADNGGGREGGADAGDDQILNGVDEGLVVGEMALPDGAVDYYA